MLKEIKASKPFKLTMIREKLCSDSTATPNIQKREVTENIIITKDKTQALWVFQSSRHKRARIYLACRRCIEITRGYDVCAKKPTLPNTLGVTLFVLGSFR